MKVLVLGAGGMLGHKVLQALRARGWETHATLHGAKDAPPFDRIELFADERVRGGVDAMALERVDLLVRELRPDALVNCVGVIKQRSAAKAALPSITINSLLPHRLAAVQAEHGGRLVHFSTDCVFSGRRGSYTEDDVSDAEDLYGRSKFLGEVEDENALTLRTSIIGRELREHRSLLDWFLGQAKGGGPVKGFTRAMWSGVTTNHLAELVGDFLERHPSLHGVYQVAGHPIAKYDLLLKLRDAYGLDVEIVPDDGMAIDRTLRGDRLREATGYHPPAWDELLGAMAADPTPYHRWVENR